MGSSKATYAFETSLPSLPIPRMATTISRYLLSVRPLMSVVEYDAHCVEVNAMVKEHGFWLQMALKV
jgi:hypothetical protein